ncbi:MAG: ATP-binding protein [Oscillospiraceae bacterium]|nr:ATP-binding protein [Oscillospiraceae bacterium]
MMRKLTNDLILWKNNSARKPLIVKGVRQCGKTYILKEFGEKYYEDTAYFNFEGNDNLQERFNGDLDVQRIVTELGIMRKKAIMPDKTLIIFDEIQFCNRALTSLKYFCENAPEYHIVCAGSLLGIALSKPLSFPVGKVDFLTLRPMCFQEFLIANGENMLCEYLENAGEASDLFANRLENYLKTYYITGGMPEAVETWLKTKDIEKLEIVQQKILDSYELDFAKHAPSKDFPKLSAIWRSIPEQLAKENSKFIFSQVKKGLRSKDLEDALEWLISAGLAFKVVKIEKPYMPLSAYADQTFFKLYMADVGLLRRMSKLPASAILEKNSAFKEFKGALTENYVLCELVNLYDCAPFYWKSDNIAEVDFIIQNNTDIVPMEVKSERNERARSLTEYKNKYNPKISVITSMKKADGNHIPLYMLWLMKNMISKN